MCYVLYVYMHRGVPRPAKYLFFHQIFSLLSPDPDKFFQIL